MSRYIDVDKAIEIWKDQDYIKLGSQETEARIMLAAVPSADVEPVKHGYWLKDEKFYHDIMVDGNPVCLYHTCSVCGVADEYITVDERPNGTHVIARHVRKYCPNCGAKMDKKQSHE